MNKPIKVKRLEIAKNENHLACLASGTVEAAIGSDTRKFPFADVGVTLTKSEKDAINGIIDRVEAGGGE